jgi:hypothetical protein
MFIRGLFFIHINDKNTNIFKHNVFYEGVLIKKHVK